MKKKIIILFILVFIIGIALGIIIDCVLLSKKNNNEDKNKVSTESYKEKIKNSSYNTEEIDSKLEELDDLYIELNDLGNQLSEVQGKIDLLENEINNATDLQFEKDIYKYEDNLEEKEQNEIADNDTMYPEDFDSVDSEATNVEDVHNNELEPE